MFVIRDSKQISANISAVIVLAKDILYPKKNRRVASAIDPNDKHKYFLKLRGDSSNRIISFNLYP